MESGLWATTAESFLRVISKLY